MKTLAKLIVLALLLMVTVGFLLPSLSPMAQPTQPMLPIAPAFWSGDSAPTTCIACFPPPCDCFPDC